MGSNHELPKPTWSYDKDDPGFMSRPISPMTPEMFVLGACTEDAELREAGQKPTQEEFLLGRREWLQRAERALRMNPREQ
jgi:hypothetical protein